jgi:hypothetical protein
MDLAAGESSEAPQLRPWSERYRFGIETLECVRDLHFLNGYVSFFSDYFN